MRESVKFDVSIFHTFFMAQETESLTTGTFFFNTDQTPASSLDAREMETMIHH